MPPRRQLSTDDLTEARRLYESGQSYRQIAPRFGVSDVTMMKMLRAVGVVSRPRGRVAPPKPPPAPQPARQQRSQRVVAIQLPPWHGMRIPIRTPAERCFRWFTAGELAAIAQAVAAGRVQRVPRGRSGLPEPSMSGGIMAFWRRAA